MVYLMGKLIVVFLFNDEKVGGVFKGYVVNYDGVLKVSQFEVSQGMLNLKFLGMFEFIKVIELKYNGVVG